MASEEIKLDRWETGPNGFLPKANNQLDRIENALNRLPTPPQQVLRGSQTTTFLAKIEAVGDSDGQYRARSVVWDDSDGGFVSPQNGVVYGGEGTARPQIWESRKLTGVPIGSIVLLKRVVGDDGQTQYIFNAVYGTSVSPDAIGGSDETETAQTTTWDRDSPTSGKDGIKINMVTRLVYDDTGDEKLYGYYRDLTFDARGLLKSVGAETRVTIDTPEECT